MRRLLWKMLRALTLGRFCIPIGSRKCVTWIVRLTRANENNCQKNVTKKFKTLTVKHSAQRELDRANQGGNQVIPLGHCEFDGSHRGLRHTLGEMTTMCGKCDALHFLEERAASSSHTNPQFTLCCAQSKVTLPPLAPPLELLRWLLTRNEADAKDFHQRIRSYNSALAFTSMGANLDTNVAQPGNYTYRLRGELYHRMGSLLPQPTEA